MYLAALMVALYYCDAFMPTRVVFVHALFVFTLKYVAIHNQIMLYSMDYSIAFSSHQSYEHITT